MKKINIVLSILLAFLLLSSCADVFPPKGVEISGENAANSSGTVTEKTVEEPPYYIYYTRTIPESEKYYSLNKTNLEEKITISICGKEFTLTHDGILDFDGWYSVRANTDTPISGRLSTLFSIIFEEKDTNVIRCISIFSSAVLNSMPDMVPNRTELMPIDEELGKERAMQYIEALAAGGRFNIQGEYPYVKTFWFRYEDDPENDLRYGSFDVCFEKRINGLTYARISITLDACGNLKDMSCAQFVDNPEAIPAFDKTAMELYCEQYERSLCPRAYSFCPEGELFQCYLVGQLKNGQYFFSVDAQDAWGEAFGYFVSSEKLLDSQGNAYAYLNH